MLAALLKRWRGEENSGRGRSDLYFKAMSYPGTLTREEVRDRFRAEDRYENGRRFVGKYMADRLTFDNLMFASAYKAEVYLAEHCDKEGRDPQAVQYMEEDGGKIWLIGMWWLIYPDDRQFLSLGKMIYTAEQKLRAIRSEIHRRRRDYPDQLTRMEPNDALYEIAIMEGATGGKGTAMRPPWQRPNTTWC
jgi:hypothetical protein